MALMGGGQMPIDMTQIRRVFAKKLTEENNLDDALLKAAWFAYQVGVSDAINDLKNGDLNKKDEKNGH
mgnify:CR=1 FL=1